MTSSMSRRKTSSESQFTTQKCPPDLGTISESVKMPTRRMSHGNPPEGQQSSILSVPRQRRYSVHECVGINDATDINVTEETIKLLLRKKELHKMINGYEKPQQRGSSNTERNKLPPISSVTTLSSSFKHARANTLPSRPYLSGKVEYLPILEERCRSKTQ